MATANDAINKALSITRYAVGMCDQFVARLYGYNSSGYATAVKNWDSTPGNLRHPGDWNAPAGALMYWGGGRTGAGHVAISLGNGKIVSTDATGPGVVGQIDAKVPTSKWGHPYLGWAFPYFQGHVATKQLGQWTGSTSTSTPADYTNGIQVSAGATTAGFLSGISQPFTMMMSSLIWISEVGIGGLLMVAAVIILTRGATT